jgi:hypothetical protein
MRTQLLLIALLVACGSCFEEETRSGILTSFTPNFFKKMKDPILDQVFKRLVESTQSNIGDVNLRDTELQFASHHH